MRHNLLIPSLLILLSSSTFARAVKEENPVDKRKPRIQKQEEQIPSNRNLFWKDEEEIREREKQFQKDKFKFEQNQYPDEEEAEAMKAKALPTLSSHPCRVMRKFPHDMAIT